MEFLARFKIGAAFPADDPAARFVTVLAMVSNDHMRTIDEFDASLGDSAAERARRTWLFRWLTASHYEAIDFIAKARAWNDSAISRLLSGSQEAQSELVAVLGAIDPRSEHYLGEWLERHRNVTFHYARVHPQAAAHGTEELHQALVQAANNDGEIIGGTSVSRNRFPFADEVVVQWMPTPEILTKLVGASVHLTKFAQLAMAEYMKSVPRGVFTFERP